MSGTVYLKDSSTPSKEASASIQPDGSFAVDVGGMTAPFILKAVGTANGKSCTLYSFATKGGTANVNPLSNVAVAIANGGTEPSALYIAPVPEKLQALKVALPDSVRKIQQALQVDFAEAGVAATDFMGGAYVVNHQGLDLMFDRKEITLYKGNVVVMDTTTRAVAYYNLINMQRMAAGTPDLSFGTNGVVTFAPRPYNFGEDILIQPDGKILVLGYSQQDTNHAFFLSRSNPDGSIDAAFGDGGVVYGPLYSSPGSLALQRDGKIVVGGQRYNGTNNITCLFRYDAEGKIDPAFGSGGSVLIDSTKNHSESKVAVQADGKIVLAATEWNGGATPFMLRLNEDGSLDTTFGNGTIGKNYLIGRGSVSALAVRSDGDIFVGVSQFEGAEQRAIIYMLNPAGIPYISFGSAGMFPAESGVAHQFIVDIKLDNAGNVIVAMGIDRYYEGGVIIRSGKAGLLTAPPVGLIPYLPNTSAPGVAVLRLRRDGTPDPTFGQGGSVMYTAGSRGVDPSGLIIQPDGKFVLSGIDFVSGLAIMRLNVEGTIDDSFGTGGLFTTSIGSYRTEGRGIALQGDGKIVVVGRSEEQSGDLYPSSMVLVRCFP